MSFEVLRDELKHIAFSAPLESIPPEVLRSLHAQHVRLPGAFALFRAWSDYTDNTDVDLSNPFALRRHIELFAEEQFGHEQRHIEVHSIPISALDEKLETYLSELPDARVAYDEHVALHGGAARTALKLLAGVNCDAELPLHDIDLIASADAGTDHISNTYGADLAGVEFVAGEIESLIPSLFTQRDCTMNQVALYNGRIYFTDQALEDAKYGAIRLVGSSKALFPADSVALPNGTVFIERPGFYRGLSFLVRGKGKKLIVSQENIDQVAPSIGRYWQILLGVKIMAMTDHSRRKTAVAHWHDLAIRLGCTNTDTPIEFLHELRAQYPDTRRSGNAGTSESNTSPENEVRWIISKLMSRSVDHIEQRPRPKYPTTYTEANITLSKSVPDFDYEEFLHSYMIQP